MTQPDAPDLPEAWGRALTGLGAATLATLDALEAAFRRLHPPLIARLRERLGPLPARLDASLDSFRAEPAPEGLAPLCDELAQGAAHAREALARFLAPAPADRAAAEILAAMRAHCRAQEALYPLRLALPPLGRLFAEPAFHDRLAELDPEPREGVATGLHRTSDPGDDDARGGFTLYVPERHTGAEARPLVVALHGGFGHGRDFVWSWLREARCRDVLLLAPTSRGTSWALDAPADEARALARMVEWVAERWRVDRERVLLTGLSDGASFALLAGLGEQTPFTHLAPVSGVLHPASSRLGNVERARGRRIYLVHGALDWMFPVGLARAAREELEKAGAALVYREIEDLSHAYPREENARILEWLDPRLALPGPHPTPG